MSDDLPDTYAGRHAGPRATPEPHLVKEPHLPTDLASQARTDLGDESARLTRVILTRAIAAVAVIVGVCVWQSQGGLDHIEALWSATAALVGILLAQVSLNVPPLMACLFLDRAHSAGPVTTATRPQRTLTAIMTLAPVVAPLHIASGSLVETVGLVIAVLPFIVFISNSLLGAMMHQWSMEAGQIAFAQAVAADESYGYPEDDLDYSYDDVPRTA